MRGVQWYQTWHMHTSCTHIENILHTYWAHLAHILHTTRTSLCTHLAHIVCTPCFFYINVMATSFFYIYIDICIYIYKLTERPVVLFERHFFQVLCRWVRLCEWGERDEERDLEARTDWLWRWCHRQIWRVSGKRSRDGNGNDILSFIQSYTCL